MKQQQHLQARLASFGYAQRVPQAGTVGALLAQTGVGSYSSMLDERDRMGMGGMNAMPGTGMSPGWAGRGKPTPPKDVEPPRHRIDVACQRCRRRKIRCSGAVGHLENKCNHCAKANHVCEFINRPPSNQSSPACSQPNSPTQHHVYMGAQYDMGGTLRGAGVNAHRPSLTTNSSSSSGGSVAGWPMTQAGMDNIATIQAQQARYQAMKRLSMPNVGMMSNTVSHHGSHPYNFNGVPLRSYTMPVPPTQPHLDQSQQQMFATPGYTGILQDDFAMPTSTGMQQNYSQQQMPHPAPIVPSTQNTDTPSPSMSESPLGGSSSPVQTFVASPATATPTGLEGKPRPGLSTLSSLSTIPTMYSNPTTAATSTASLHMHKSGLIPTSADGLSLFTPNTEKSMFKFLKDMTPSPAIGAGLVDVTKGGLEVQAPAAENDEKPASIDVKNEVEA
ncbi:hypothetical protein SAICODRAFT_30083 [Saitoella complicata NRRL Y-17804]|nr:uncharacterized protein SAICODRAFT_30083 [Saitoella complicata NRRL Y-17804]ODQ53332.1 hypothetical protein SAICODRAFT_30083 [Saitoella complicata NRRL Y-17804]